MLKINLNQLETSNYLAEIGDRVWLEDSNQYGVVETLTDNNEVEDVKLDDGSLINVLGKVVMLVIDDKETIIAVISLIRKIKNLFKNFNLNFKLKKGKKKKAKKSKKK